MDHPIYKAIVLVHNQEDCDVARDICVKHSLPTWKDIAKGFDYVDYNDPDDDNNDDEPTYLQYQGKDSSRDDDSIGFYVDSVEDDIDDYNIVSIEEFIALANDLNPIYNDMEDILSKLKEINNILNNK